MEKITENSTIKQLLEFISYLEKGAGDAYQMSEGADNAAGDEANKLLALQHDIREFINPSA